MLLDELAVSTRSELLHNSSESDSCEYYTEYINSVKQKVLSTHYMQYTGKYNLVKNLYFWMVKLGKLVN